jgi:hypothetical protein
MMFKFHIKIVFIVNKILNKILKISNKLFKIYKKILVKINSNNKASIISIY